MLGVAVPRPSRRRRPTAATRRSADGVAGPSRAACCRTSASAAPDRRLIFGLNDFLDERFPDRSSGTSSVSASALRRWPARYCGSRLRTRGSLRRRPPRRAAPASNTRLLNGLSCTRAGDIDDLLDNLGPPTRRQAAQRFERNVAKATAKDSPRFLDRLTEVVDGKRLDHQRPAADRADRGSSWTRQMARAPACATPTARAGTGARCPATAATCSTLPLRARRAQGGRRSASARAPGSFRCSATTTATRCSAVQGGPAVGARTAPRQEQVRDSSDSASSRVSGRRRPPATSCSAGSAPPASTVQRLHIPASPRTARAGAPADRKPDAMAEYARPWLTPGQGARSLRRRVAIGAICSRRPMP